MTTQTSKQPARFYEPAKDANWRQRNADKIESYNRAVREARAK